MVSRRQALRASAAAAASVLAGCSGVESVLSGGDGGSGGFDGSPEPYAQFAAGGDWEWTTFSVALDEVPWRSLHEATRQRLESHVTWTGLDRDEPDRVVLADGTGVATGGFDRDAARDAVSAVHGSLESVNDGAFEVAYGGESAWTPVLVGDGVVVTAGPVLDGYSGPARDLVQERFGDWDGSVSALATDADPPGNVQRVVDALGDPPIVSVWVSPLIGGVVGGPPMPPAATRFGTAWDVGTDRTTVRTAFAYPDGETPDAVTLADVYPDLGGGDGYVRGLGEYGDRTVSVSDRTVTVTAEVSTKAFDLLHAGTPSPPDASFSVSFEDGSVTVTHAGGARVPAVTLYVVVGEKPGRRAFTRRHRNEWVSDGDAATVRVDAPSGTQVAVEWRPGIDPDAAATTVP